MLSFSMTADDHSVQHQVDLNVHSGSSNSQSNGVSAITQTKFILNITMIQNMLHHCFHLLIDSVSSPDGKSNFHDRVENSSLLETSDGNITFTQKVNNQQQSLQGNSDSSSEGNHFTRVVLSQLWSWLTNCDILFILCFIIHQLKW